MIMKTLFKAMKKTGYCIVMLSALAVLLTGCGGGGGGTATTPPATTPPATTGTMFLLVSEPSSSGQLYTSSSLTVRGQTLAGATVTVNGASATVNSDGTFSKAVTLSSTSNPNTITVTAVGSSATYTINRSVYYQDASRCTLIYTATDPQSGRDRIFDVDPSIPGSARMISPDTPGATDSAPALSPDRRMVLFVRDINGAQSLMKVTCASSSVYATLATGAHFLAPAWSKNGTNIAFAMDSPGNYELFFMSGDGAGLTRVTAHSGFDDSPTFSADGTSLVFASNRNVNGGASVGQKFNLWRVTISPAVGTPSLIYNAAAAQGPTCPQGAGNCSALNPDLNASNQLVFQFETTCTTSSSATAPPGSTCNDLYTLPLNTPASITRLAWGTNYYTRPRWNADGNSVVFLRTTSTGTAALQLPVVSGVPGSVSETGVSSCNAPDW